MTVLLLFPLLLPFVVPPLARRAERCLAPAAALWVLTLAAVALAGGSLTALGALVLTGLLKLPVLAAFGELIHPLRTPWDAVAVPSAAASVGLLVVGAWTLTRSALRQARAVRAAHAEAARRPVAGDLCVIDSPYPDAFALPGRPARVVVTTAMIRSLGPTEREVLFAHERAHNAGRHHYFLATAELAAHCHPALRAVRTSIRFAAERAADEAAAAAVGDRRLAARAIARAALAVGARRPERPVVAPAATTGPVPRRVAALLAGPPPRAHRAAPWIAALLALCATAAAGASVTGLVAFHHDVEVAQGEAAH
ncbi:peptidase M48 Ste24p [Streptomyces eurocidicus]|uniref:Peptidase M48 Ste24p n=1 Tax=Streptomyces eurocidicus TaxID=66423 RepID=A0A2N8NTZ0_STREU|nr:M48 family metalloprotease [Streptomyces eurocidicus]MBB5119311.1 Zn-dependent protease with chaperone function [Streptomyces eurocidicus]MBF6053107.1 M48 family metalloprotease [Streptomyces eurocidicus]PNE32214.1 peptidase M48 Ste24p [Streptomyces eurocidicus]